MRLLAPATVLLASLTSGCATVNAALDVQAIGEKARLATRHGRAPVGPWPFTSDEALERRTRPREQPVVERLPIGVRTLRVEGLVEEQLAFRSQVTPRFVESNHARVYVHRHGRWGERPVLLWVPGLAVSDLALTLLRPLLVDALDAGVDVVFFVPPYHLERTPAGRGSGDAVLATDLADHLGVIEAGIADLREVVRLLRGWGVRRLGVFGGSMGANLALQVARYDGTVAHPAFDFFTAMIPLLDWGGLLLDRPEFGEVRARLVEGGVSLEALAALYRELDPSRRDASLPPETVCVLAARDDQVTPAGPRERWQARWGLSRVRVLERGHATMLLGGTLRDAARACLTEDLAASR